MKAKRIHVPPQQSVNEPPTCAYCVWAYLNNRRSPCTLLRSQVYGKLRLIRWGTLTSTPDLWSTFFAIGCTIPRDISPAYVSDGHARRHAPADRSLKDASRPEHVLHSPALFSSPEV